jgi:hypothetical protein
VRGFGIAAERAADVDVDRGLTDGVDLVGIAVTGLVIERFFSLSTQVVVDAVGRPRHQSQLLQLEGSSNVNLRFSARA